MKKSCKSGILGYMNLAGPALKELIFHPQKQKGKVSIGISQVNASHGYSCVTQIFMFIFLCKDLNIHTFLCTLIDWLVSRYDVHTRNIALLSSLSELT